MAFSGVHIVYGMLQNVSESSDVFGGALWSETMAAPGVTALAATKATARVDAFSILPTFDVFVAIGNAPNAAQSPRHLVLAGERVLLPCALGDKVAWVAA
ncbi:hypothetical protein V5F41_12260 [Xanthobacter autotrophicus]|uniref:hypothetical protein n=1 Tax=Xanthobacter autotrophicus TaxID=280 RepID=UPI003729C377